MQSIAALCICMVKSIVGGAGFCLTTMSVKVSRGHS